MAGILQSSSATGVLASSFARKGLLTVPIGIAILLGADIGSTIMVRILTFDISWLSLIALIIGYIVFRKGENTHTSELGRAIMGVGLIILSLQIMSTSMLPLCDREIFLNILTTLSTQTWLAIILVAITTWFMHSSIAMVLIIIGFAVAGTLRLETSLIFVLSANIGAAIIPLVLTIKDRPRSRHIPLGSFIIRTFIAITVLPFMWIIIPIWDNLFDNIGLSIAMFHTAFNIIVLIIGLPLIGVVSNLCESIIPIVAEKTKLGAKSLKSSQIKNPLIAIPSSEREVIIQAGYVEKMLQNVIGCISNDDVKKAKKIADMDNYVDALYEDIKMYITKVSRMELTSEQSQRVTNIITYTTNLEHVGDIIEQNLLAIASK